MENIKSYFLDKMEKYYAADREFRIKKYKTYSEFRKNAGGAHNSSFKNGWLYEILDIYIPEYRKRKSPN